MSIVVAIGTLVILYLAYGYDIDRENGGVIQNGIVFVDSKPQGASIYLNDVRQGNQTDTRMVLPAGLYTVRLEAENYRSWERTFNLEGGQIQRLVYPLLIPNSLEINDVAQYDSVPSLMTQSPDRRWVLIQRPSQQYLFDLYDLNDPTNPPVSVTVPASVMTDPTIADAVLKVVEWSNDNRHVLIERSYSGTNEFIMFDSVNPQLSVNLNTAFGVKPAVVTLRNKRPDQVYYLDAVPGVLRSMDLRSRTLSAPLIAGVISYKTYGDDIVLFATQVDVEAGKTEFRILDTDKVYTLRIATESDVYLLEVARYENRWYYAVGSAADNMVFVYQNPLTSLKSEGRRPLDTSGILRITNPRSVSFSANTQYIAVQSGKDIVTIDLEDNTQYRTTLNHDIPLTQTIKWMDGHRFVYVVNGQSYIIDFDGSNEETLVTMQQPFEPIFDRDYDNVFTLETSKQDSTKAALTQTVID